MKLLGIDFGTKRIGIAVGDTDSKIASPLFTLAADEKIFNELTQLIRAEQIEALVIGLPKSLREKTTSEGETESRAREFAEHLSLQISIPIYWEDERFSTDLAIRLVGAKGKDRDAVAASIILQSYLDKVTSNE